MSSKSIAGSLWPFLLSVCMALGCSSGNGLGRVAGRPDEPIVPQSDAGPQVDGEGAESGDVAQGSPNEAGAPVGTDGQAGGGPCTGLVEEVTVLLDGQPIGAVSIVTGAMAASTTSGTGFGIIASLNDVAQSVQREVLVGATGLSVGTHDPQAVSLSVEYREYGTASVPYSQLNDLKPMSLAGTVEVIAVATQPGDRVCGSFDVTGSATNGWGSGTHTIRVQGHFNEVLAANQRG